MTGHHFMGNILTSHYDNMLFRPLKIGIYILKLAKIGGCGQVIKALDSRLEGRRFEYPRSAISIEVTSQS